MSCLLFNVLLPFEFLYNMILLEILQASVNNSNSYGALPSVLSQAITCCL